MLHSRPEYRFRVSAADSVMAENWNHYQRRVNAYPVSIFVDLGLADRAPEPVRPMLVQVRYPLLSPAADGLSDPVEAETLFAIEDWLFAAVSRPHQARYVGRKTEHATRTHYYYGPPEITGEGIAQRARQQFPGYVFEVALQPDRDWLAYFTELQPTRLERQTLETARQIEALEAAGDDLRHPRLIEHVAHFPSATARDQFLAQIAGTGFSVRQISPPEGDADADAEFCYVLRLTREDPADPVSLDGLVSDLLLRCENCGGVYSGWGQGMRV